MCITHMLVQYIGNHCGCSSQHNDKLDVSCALLMSDKCRSVDYACEGEAMDLSASYCVTSTTTCTRGACHNML